MTTNMMEFQDCINKIKVDDLCKTGLHFTWTKNLQKTKVGNMTGILKKLDRVMINEDFIKQYPQGHAKFLPYVISDHTPAILCIPTSIKKKVKPFRFSNFLIDKQEFIEIVKEKGRIEVPGYFMYQVVMKLKSMKSPLNKLSWSKGNLFKRVEMLRGQLQEVQTEIDQDPHNPLLRDKEVGLVQSIQDSDDLFSSKINVRDYKNMIMNITDAEIKNAMFDIDGSKAPGPDGFTADFFKKAWGIIGNDICKAVREFFENDRMLGQLNAIIVSLILKIQTSSKVTDFRPISYYNVLYKCTSKELMRGYNRKNGPKRVAFKIDLQKAYDTISWDFLKSTLEGFGFHERMIQWIMECVTTTAFTLNVNGERVGYFKGGRGLRQGDPMSPYLFTLIMEVFTLILHRQIAKEPKFQYHFGCKEILLTHVCFADDLLVMCHGDKVSVEVIKKALQEFSSCPGLLPNNAKSSVFFGSIKEVDKNSIISVLPFSIGKFPVKHLGVSLIAKRLGIKECGCLLDKIKCRIKNWRNRSLSYAGILQLIATVLESIHLRGKPKLLRAKSADQRTKEHVIYKIGNGMNTPLWFDNWSSIGPLFESLDYRSLYDARLNRDLKVNELICNGEWMWPVDWHIKFPHIVNIEVPMIRDGEIDKIVWKTSSGKSVSLSILSFYDWLSKESEDLQHLFFQCPFSKNVWSQAKKMADIIGNEFDWDEIMQTLNSVGNGNNINSVVRRFIFAAGVYNIWQEIHKRIFKNVMSSSEEVYKQIIEIVRNKLLGIKVKNSSAVRIVESRWSISLNKV
ncbi:RNA-directed DNA polymerase, eukaryota, reverse transcriptase zinc-binding domain protein [Tanacetum coccineum]|uniref:RNA-directed DNA polymerase, eukaryota, reverse transcriptase zinc-binding domain protein n=1 Tax=Tanacetum coccineum TaxID=301880 RepID=A0ABQ5BPG0_9ASTR